MGGLWKRNAAVIFGIKGQQGTRVEDLKISFEIEKTSESNTNSATILIYNLNPNHRGILQKEENLFIILEVGYGGEFNQLFIGDISKVIITKQGNDWVTNIEAGDGNQSLKDATLDKSYKNGTPIKTIINDAIDSMKVTGNVVAGVISDVGDEVFQQGVSISDTAKNVIDKLTSKLGLEFSIQDNEIQILGPDSDIGDSAILINPDLGLIGSPIKRDKGIEFTALIFTTKVRPGILVKLESREIEGTFKVRKINFVGDTRGNDWVMKGICDVSK
jgi:hypothetical protein